MSPQLQERKTFILEDRNGPMMGYLEVRLNPARVGLEPTVSIAPVEPNGTIIGHTVRTVSLDALRLILRQAANEVDAT